MENNSETLLVSELNWFEISSIQINFPDTQKGEIR